MFEHVAIAHQYCIILCSLPSSIHTEPILCECYQQSPSIPVRLAGAGGGADPKRTEVKDGFFRVKDCFSPTCLYNSGKSTGVLYGPKSMGYFGVPSGSLRGPFGVPLSFNEKKPISSNKSHVGTHAVHVGSGCPFPNRFWSNRPATFGPVSECFAATHRKKRKSDALWESSIS